MPALSFLLKGRLMSVTGPPETRPEGGLNKELPHRGAQRCRTLSSSPPHIILGDVGSDQPTLRGTSEPDSGIEPSVHFIRFSDSSRQQREGGFGGWRDVGISGCQSQQQPVQRKGRVEGCQFQATQCQLRLGMTGEGSRKAMVLSLICLS